MENNIKNFKIPTTFVLFGHKYKVTMRDDLFNTRGLYGTADDDLKEIVIQKASRICKHDKEENTDEWFEMTNNTVVETFYHELTHAIFDAMGESELSENEALVNMLAKAWLEIYLSSSYEEDPKKEV